MEASGDLAAQLDRVRLESGTLYDLIGAIASSPDLDRVLEGVVDLLTKATDCHACFVYLRVDDRLRLRAASRVYAHLVGRIEFGVDEGLAGWAVRRSEIGYIPDDALADERTNYVAELEEERFQSMVAVPIPTRGGDPMGAIVLHTIAPREFDADTLNLLSHAAPLIAGPIENAQLLEDARRRVAALTDLSGLSHRIAAAETRGDLYAAATHGVRSLLRCDQVRLYELDAARRRLDLVAAEPPVAEPHSTSTTTILLELLQEGRTESAERLRDVLRLGDDAGHVLAAPISAGEEHRGVLVAAGVPARPPGARELLHAVANQTAVALRKTELIERLTEENVVRDLFAALERGQLDAAQARALRVHADLEQPHVFVTAVPARDPAGDSRPWQVAAELAERRLRRLVPGALCDAGDDRLRALLTLDAASDRALASLDSALDELGAELGLGVGRSGVRRTAAQPLGGLAEAADAAAVAAALTSAGGALAYPALGAYRYLVPLVEGDAARTDPHLDAVRTLQDYDRRRGSELLTTLERYLSDRRGVTETARALTVHPNTLRQRLDRIQTLTGLDLATADLLALELAIKFARLKPRP